MYETQQYCMNSAGYPPLVQWIAGHVAEMHAPPRPTLPFVTCGSTNSIDLVLRTLCDRGDCVLTEEFTYSATLQAMRPLGVQPVGIAGDAEGPLPGALRAEVLRRRAAGLPKPKLFYGIPVSCNPTGVSWSEARKDAIYALCSELDLLILEDDAYFYLQFPDPADPRSAGHPPPGLEGLGRSLLARDVDGRVIRADTFSKNLAPGLRLGWLVTPPRVGEALLRTLQSSIQSACSLTQVVTARLLGGWGRAGLHAHAQRLQGEYGRRARTLLAALNANLGPSAPGNGGVALASWQPPRAGMFLWVRLGCGVTDSETLQEHLKEYKVVAVPGRHFHAQGLPSPFIRLSFASASDADFQAGMARLASLLRSLPGAPVASPPTPGAPATCAGQYAAEGLGLGLAAWHSLPGLGVFRID